MNIRRLRKLAGILAETVTSDAEINKIIDDFVEQFTPDQRGLYLDAIEAVYDRADRGITVNDWAAHLRQIHGTDVPVREVLLNVAKEFPYVAKVGDKQYGWRAPRADDDPMHGMVSDQVNLVYDAMEVIKQRGELSEDEWADALRGKMPQMSRQAALSYINHIVNQFPGVLVPAGPRRWRYQKETQQDSMELLKSIVNSPKTT